ncbi:hypothetical protein Bca101_046566 [Brassica carinata]
MTLLTTHNIKDKVNKVNGIHVLQFCGLRRRLEVSTAIDLAVSDLNLHGSSSPAIHITIVCSCHRNSIVSLSQRCTKLISLQMMAERS